MYEENQRPLPPGDSVAVFAHALAEIERLSSSVPRPSSTCDPVVQEPNIAAQPLFAAICRRLLLPESTLVGFDNLAALADLAVAKLSPITSEMTRLMKDPAEIDRILGEGAARADAIARPIVDEVYEIMGMIRSRQF